MTETIFPQFIGFTDSGEKITIYHIRNEIHLQVDDGEVWALSPDSKLNTYHDTLSSIMEVEVQSKEWSGTARGGKHLIEAAEPLRR